MTKISDIKVTKEFKGDVSDFTTFDEWWTYFLYNTISPYLRYTNRIGTEDNKDRIVQRLEEFQKIVYDAGGHFGVLKQTIDAEFTIGIVGLW